MRKILSFLFVAALTSTALAQTIELSLDSCLALAIRNNKELSIAEMKAEAAHYNRKEAFTHFLPRIDAMGGYFRNEKEFSILNDDQKEALSNLGTTVGTTMSTAMTQLIQGYAQQDPAAAQALQQQLAPLGQLVGGMAPALNEAGAGIVDAFRTDTRNVTAAALMLTQPIYMGGKIVAYNRITKYAEQIAGAQKDQKTQELIVNVETAYWQIVSLESKRELAQSYKLLIDTLDYNVQQLIEQGLAAKADGLSVKVKKNEAEVTLIQVDNGLALCRMLLAQLCGLEAGVEISPTDRIEEQALAENLYTASEASELAMSNRPELTSLGLLSQINNEKVKVVRAEYLPQVALSANYLWSNPNLYNGFEKKMKGMWNVGVMVKIPLISWGESYYKVKAAKSQANIAQFTYDEAREKIELQTTQCVQKVSEATKRLEAARSSMETADENLRYATIGMQEGVIPISNVIAAQTAWLSAHSTLISAQIDQRLAEVNLKRAIGALK